MSAGNEDKPEPQLGNGMGEIITTKAIMLPSHLHSLAFVNEDFNANTQVGIPFGFKSTGWSVSLQIIVWNH